MLEIDEAIQIAKENNKGFLIKEYIDIKDRYIFPIVTVNGGDGTTFYYEVNKNTGEHGIFNFWSNMITNPDFRNVNKNRHKIEIG